MPQISYISVKDIIKEDRMEAEFFCLNSKLNSNFIYWKDIIKRVQYWTSDALNEENLWYPILRLNEFDGLFIWQPSKYCNLLSEEKYVNLKLKQWDILVCRTNWNKEFVWRSSIVMEDQEIGFASYLFRLQPNDLINSETLLIYLNTLIWKQEISKYKMVANQANFSPAKFNKIKIPKIKKDIQQKIKIQVQNAYFKKQQSKQLYQEAEELLLTELGLKDHSFSHALTFTTTKKEVDQAGRYDADYFQPKYDEILEKIDQYQGGWDFVENIFEYKKWFEPWTEAYVEEWKNFVRVSDFSKFWLEWTDKKISEEMFDELKDNYAPKKWEILFTKDWTIGISYLLKEDFEGILSWAFLRLQLKEAYKAYDKECLTLILNSIICSLQVERFSGWALIAHLKPSDFQKLKLPLIDPQIQQLISAKVQESFRLRNESKQLLEQAKKMVEDEIEKE